MPLRRIHVLSIGLTALLTAACGQQVAGEAKAAQNAAIGNPPTIKQTSVRTPKTSSTSPPSNDDKLNALAGTWEGEYTCGQGHTGLKLTIKKLENGGLPSTFEFFPLAENPDVPKGSYTMIGRLGSSPQPQLTFKQQQWVNQPPGYEMVDLLVTSRIEANTTQLSGDVLVDNCKGFAVRKR